MRRHLTSIAFSLALLSLPAPAMAAFWDQGILSGNQLVWVGTAANTNQLNLQPGEIKINGTTHTVTGGGFITTALGACCTFFEAGTGGSQAANTAYYFYAAIRPTTGGVDFVISTIQPNTGGEPSQNLVWTPVVGNPAVNTGSALFLGSWITDSNSNIVPFLKEGDDVILTPSEDTDTPGQGPYSQFVTFNTTGAYPQVKTATFGAGAPPIPLSASGLILDFNLSNTDSTFHEVRILNPTLDTDVGAGVCTANAQYYMAVSQVVAGLATPAWPYEHARIKTAINTSIPAGTSDGGPGTPTNALNTVQIGACTAPATGTSYTLAVLMVGYTEVTHHLSY